MICKTCWHLFSTTFQNALFMLWIRHTEVAPFALHSFGWMHGNFSLGDLENYCNCCTRQLAPLLNFGAAHSELDRSLTVTLKLVALLRLTGWSLTKAPTCFLANSMACGTAHVWSQRRLRKPQMEKDALDAGATFMLPSRCWPEEG